MTAVERGQETDDSATHLSSRRPMRWQGLVVRPVLIAVGLTALFLVARDLPQDEIVRRNFNGPVIRTQLRQHVELSVLATLLTIVIAVPLGIMLSHSPSRVLKAVVLGLGNLGQAVPSIGLIVLLAMWIGVGPGTALIALVAYAVLPVLRNTVVGLQGVDPVLIEAGQAMGLSKWSLLTRIELPLAVPVILAGIRTALVLTVASATLATFIDGGGLGGGLVTGLGLNRPVLSITFGLLVAALALFADWIGLVLEEVFRPHGMK